MVLRMHVATTHHRPVRTALCVVVALLCVFAHLAHAVMTFTTPNVVQASLYQTVRVSLQSNIATADPPVVTGDRVYLYDATLAGSTCTYTDPAATTQTTFTVTASTGGGGYTGATTIPILASLFTVGTSYTLCYLSASLQSATVVLRPSSVAQSAGLLVWPALYDSYTLSPSAPTGSEGVVNLTIHEVTQADRPLNQALTGSSTIFLLPCAAVTSTSASASCADLDTLTQACAAAGVAGTSNTAGVVSLSGLRGQSTTDSITGGFTVPYMPDSTGYAVCVPYCADTSCTSAATLSFAVVAASPSPLLTFGAANPGLYTRSPTAPQARELGYLYFSGTGLAAGDVVRVIRADQSCTSSTASLLTNLQVGAVEAASAASGATVQASFIAPNLVTETMVGKVCYQRAATGLSSTVYETAASAPIGDFTIQPLQPSSFTISPANPALGEVVVLTFSGTGLSATDDDAFVSLSAESDPCATATLQPDERFDCVMSGTASNPICTVVVDPPSVNQGVSAAVCYRKASGFNYAELADGVELGNRNPTYTVTPYPLYAGQTAVITFVGSGLSAADDVMFIEAGASCDGGSQIASVEVRAGQEVTSGTAYSYAFVGSAASQCLDVCYRFTGGVNWVVARAQTPLPAIASTCAAQQLYVASFPVRYTFPSLASSLTAMETATMRFTSATGASITGNTVAPTAVKLVRATDACAVQSCTGLTACERDGSTLDYVSAISTASTSVTVWLSQASTNVIICVLNAASGTAYIPVLPLTTSSPTATTYGLTAAAQAAILNSFTPGTWRVRLATLGAQVLSANGLLDASTNSIYAVNTTNILTLVNEEAVCVLPSAGTSISSPLVSRLNTTTSTATSVDAEFTRSDRLSANQVLYLCYEWSENGVSRVTYLGTTTVAAAIPTAAFPVNMPSGGYSAGLPAAVRFTISNPSAVSGELDPATDSVFFYRYVQSSNPEPNCHCDPVACAGGTYIAYDPSVAGFTTTVAGSSLEYYTAVGFDNYDFRAIYLVCYVSSAAEGVSYMGQLDVRMANPTYYTVASVAGTVNRVGAPINVTAVRRCLTTGCTALSTSDVMLLVPSATACADVVSEDEFASVAQTISTTVMQGGVSYQRRFVVDVVGEYRVCYRLASEATFHELVFSDQTVRQTLSVIEANPSAYVTTPPSPTAGQFLEMQLTCSNTLCTSCTAIRLIPGARASCWSSTDVAGSYASDNCLSPSLVQFPGQFIAAGTYTVCYANNRVTSRRLPGVFTVGAANPSVYMPASTSVSIYTNQATDFVLDITGTGLTASDDVFLLPALGYTCHDLRTGEIQNNGTLASWLAPSVQPYPVTVTATGATWVASNQASRFGAGLLADTSLCGSSTACEMQLCYRRAGTTWGPVPVQTPPPVQVVPSNPASAAFDHYPLFEGLYTMVTVEGIGLAAADEVRVHVDSCAGAVVTISTATPVVNAEASRWVGVLRFSGTSSSTASYAVCYWQASSGGASEIVNFILPDGSTSESVLVFATPLYFALSTTNFTSAQYRPSQYEELIVGATFYEAGGQTVMLASASVIDGDTDVAECNYEPFFVATGTTVTAVREPVLDVMAPVSSTSSMLYQSRLGYSQFIALCMNSTAYGLFRVAASPPSAARVADDSNALWIQPANPLSYESQPLVPNPGQFTTLTFSANSDASSPSSPTTTVTPLAVGDTVQIITGSRYECGFANTTIVAEGLVDTADATGTSASATVLLSADVDPATLQNGGYVTVCYRKQDGTFATTPRNGLVDYNLHLMPQIPTQWTSVPSQVQVNGAAVIEFAGDSAEPDFLETADYVFLVNATDLGATVGTAEMCARESSAPVLTSTDPLTRNGINTQWSIPANTLQEGVYMFCYVAAKNGAPVYVASPAFFEVYAAVSPYGAYTNKGDTLAVVQGERFYLFFNTSEVLDVVLDDGAQTAEALQGRDVVTFSSTADCATPLDATSIVAIPDSFGYLAPSQTDPVSGVAAPYLHLRVRAAVGAYSICMRRANRETWQVYYNAEVVGAGIGRSAVLSVSAAPLSTFTTSPTAPRVGVPNTAVALTFADAATTVATVAQIFFVPFTGTSTTAADEILYDTCYRPLTAADAQSSTVVLVNTTLQVDLATLLTTYAFPASGQYLMCYEMLDDSSSSDTNRFVASVFPQALTVNPASPIAYTVPAVVSTQNLFTLGLTYVDSIFASGTSNTMHIYNFTSADLESTPSCEGGQPPAEGSTDTFTAFTVTNTSYATVQPLIMTAGYYYVCFLTFDQIQYMPVPNVAGGYVFPVGLTGAQSYTAAPQPAYLGQQLDLTINGNTMSSADRVKVVDVTSLGESASYVSVCTAEAVNADAAEAQGALGSAVSSTNGIVTHYYPRLNASGTFVLCYQSAPAGGDWVYIANIPSFTVGAAHPTSYAQWPEPTYETEVAYLYVYDTDGLLTANDEVKLVTRTGLFDCTEAATQSANVGTLEYDAAASTASVAAYRLCGTTASEVTVCYRLASSPAWAEVPLSSPPATPTYVFEPAVFAADPFTGPTVTTTSGLAPRPYEPFNATFVSSVAGVSVTFIGFSMAPREVCAVTVDYITPTYYARSTTAAAATDSLFALALPRAGEYVVHLGTRDNVLDPNITHTTTLTIAACDPCSLTPEYTFVGNTVTLTFPSATGTSLATGDAMRLIPISQGLSGMPCDAPTGPYADTTFAPVSVGPGGSSASYSVSAGTQAEAALYLGEYYACYRKSAAGAFAIVADNEGVPAAFSVYPTDVVVADACPASNALYGLETLELTVTLRDPTTYPHAAFAASDEFVLVPVDALTTTGSCEELTSASVAQGGIAGLLRPNLDVIGTASAVWNVTLPRLTVATSYEACYRLSQDTIFRNVMTSALVVQPANPLSVSHTPALVLPESTNVVVTITGSGLQAGDEVFVVGEGVSCAETCSNAPLTPQVWVGTGYTRVDTDASTVTLQFNGALNVQTTLGICYRRVGAYLTRVGSLVVGDPNPISYTTSFVPRVGTRPTLTFYGENLTSTDAFLIVPPGADCLESNVVAAGSFVDVATNATWSSFLLPLDAAGVSAGNYTVCYQVSTVGAYGVVPPELPVLPGGPSTFAASNRPMQGRTLTLTFPTTSAMGGDGTVMYTPQAGDEVFVACPTCSCFEGDEATQATVEAAYATVPYGTVSGTVATTDPESFALRFALDDTAVYPVCYRVEDSGFAQVGGTSSGPTTSEPVTALSRLAPVVNSPAQVDIFPLPTYQGQRLTYNFTNFSTDVPLGTGDAVMLVDITRGCWENETLLSTDIVIQPSTATAVVASAIASWAAHIPSLGPDTPSATLFPLSYMLCYREVGQPEYVAVPYPTDTTTPDTLAAADPSTFTTEPASLETGMLGIAVTFPGAAEGDEAYLVGFDTLTNTVCTDTASTVLSAQGPSWPDYTMQIPGDATVSSSNAALCYIKNGATVAEVPQLVAITAGNPYNYTTNVSTIVPSEARERQYIAFTVLGAGLDAAVDVVAFTEAPCGSVAMPITSSAYLARLGDRTANAEGTELSFVAQFIAPTSPVTMHLCYQLGGSVWREVGAALVLESPQPSAGELFSVSGSSSVPRAGQHLYIALIDPPGDALPAQVAVLTADNAQPGSWCHNFTDADVREPYLQVSNAGLLDIPVWQVPGLARLCIRYPDTIWTDVGSTVDVASAYEVMPANPASLAPFPEPPRVGQQVTLTFFGVMNASAGDVIKLTEPDNTSPCETASGVPGLTALIPVTVVDTTRTTATLIDSTDVFGYRSFNRTGAFRVCYYSQAENAWGVVGGTLAASTVTVEAQVPQSWSVVSGDLVMGQPFRIQFDDSLGVLNATGDRAWAVPSGQSCAVDPATTNCPGCIVFDFNETISTSQTVVTTEAVSVIVDDMNICYALYNATPALVDGALSITAGPIECVQQDTVIIGQQQTVTFRIQDGVDVTADSWRVSFYATTQSDCQARYMDDFVQGRAVQTTVTATSVSYALEWPVALTNSSYTICYDHAGIIGPVCTCGQIDGRTGECFIQTSPGSPSSFGTSPSPTYVGETITLTLQVLPAMTLYPPTAVKLVSLVNGLTTCADAAAFYTPATPPTALNSTHFTYTFKHDYALGSSTLLVCALTDLSPEYARVGNAALNNTLWIRPFMTVSTFPSLPQYIRAMQTLNTTFTHETQLADDVVSLSDQITLVADPYDCVESVINAQDPSSVMSMLELDDTAFLSVPATVSRANSAAFDTGTLLTFNAAGVGARYFCYRLAAGTWAPVLPALDILSPVVDSCSLAATPSASNGYDGLTVRAMQYVPLTLVSSTTVLGDLYSTADEVRVVPQGELCSRDSSAVFTTSTSSSAEAASSVQAIWFAPAGGTTYKVCYRFVSATNGTAMSNWSPACTDITTGAPSPTGSFTGCLNQGQTLDVTAAQQGSYTYAAGDTFRYVGAGVDCLTLTGATAATGSITVNDAAQAATGLALTATEAGTTTYDVPYAVLGTGTTAVRLCYTDAAGNQFAVPLDYATRPTVSALSVNARQPTSVTYQGTLQLGQRLRVNFTAATVTNAATGTTSLLTSPPLTPYALLPTPLVPAPAFDGTFDGSTLLSLGATATVYRDGRCAAAARASTSAASAVNPLNLTGVYGAVMQSVPYTIGTFDPVSAAFYVSCYETPTCGVSDVGAPVRVLPYNPSNVYVTVSAPRRGQLIDVVFDRDVTTGASVPLTPGADRAVKQANLASCWTLADTAGTIVTGTTEATEFTTILYAQAPSQAVTTETRSCYKLSQSAWSEVPNGVAPVLAANPVGFESTPSRRFTANQLTFTGSSFSAGDVAKIIPLSLNCSEASAPPSSLTAYAADGSTLVSTSAGWPLSFVSADGTSAALNFTSSETGTFSVCYRLATDTVWTLVYSDLVIGERDPASMMQTPVSTLEGELFTMNFTSSNSAGAALSAGDYVALYYGADANCMQPSTSAAPVITAAPSRNELPSSIAFQMAAGTRGTYTVCYFNAQGNGLFLPSWGFSAVVVEPNPRSLRVFPNITTALPAGTAVLRHQELVTLVFEGWGLVSTETKWDAVRLVDAATLPQEDTSCEAVNAATDVALYPLSANGTFSSQVFRATSADSSSSTYWVCYKLNGGQFHIVDGDAITIAAPADPSSASDVAGKLANSASVQNGEEVTWALTVPSSTTADCSADDVLFYSETLCNDVPYYADPASVTVSSLSELGAAAMTCGATTVAVRIGTYLPTMPTTLSLCYWHNASRSASLVPGGDVIPVVAGVPSPLTVTIVTPAQKLFEFELQVTPGASDYVVLVTEPAQCVGLTAPADQAFFTNATFNAVSGQLEVTSAVPRAGTYYVCYSHASSDVTNPSVEHARVVGTVHATSADPQGWRVEPSPIYQGDSARVSFQFTDADSAAAQATASVWLVQITADAADVDGVTMLRIATRCGETPNSTMQGVAERAAGTVFDLAFDATTSTWQATSAFTTRGRFALCYDTSAAVAAAAAMGRTTRAFLTLYPTIFGPAADAGPVVWPSEVTSVSFTKEPVRVGEDAVAVVEGGGLAPADELVAVGVASGVAVPDDVCTNASYTPRVSSTVASGTTSTTVAMRSFLFSQAGDYVLCYESAASLTGTDPTGPQLVSATPFTVSSSVVSVSVVGQALYVDAPATFAFVGSGLAVTDEAALVFVGDLTAEEANSASVVCEAATTVYTAMASASADGSSATFTTTPTIAGVHAMCYRRDSTTTSLLSTRFTVAVQTVVSAAFTVQPGGCQAYYACLAQPVVTMRNSSGLPASDPSATVSLALVEATTGSAADAGVLAGDSLYVMSADGTAFTFLAMRVTAAGTYQLVATVTLAGGSTTLQTTSAAFTVSESGGGDVTAIANMTCTPQGMLPTAMTAVSCTIAAVSSSAPSNYTIQLTSGTATACVAAGTTSNGLPICAFTVTPPVSSATAVPTNYLVITATPLEPYTTWPVANSPTVVWLPSTPEIASTLTCSRNMTANGGVTALPSADLVRAGDDLVCTMQPRVVRSGVTVDAAALSSTLRAQYYTNDNAAAATSVALGTTPSTMTGAFTFHIGVADVRRVVVTGEVEDSTTTNAWAAMTNSPQQFNVIGVPTAAASSLACNSSRTGSLRWYTLTEPLGCIVALADAGGAVNGLVSDFSVQMPEGGSAQFVSGTTVYGTDLALRGAAPAQATSASAAVAAATAVAAAPRASSFNDVFTVVVSSSSSTAVLSTYDGILVYVSTVGAVPTLTVGATVTLTFTGSGLDTTHRYMVTSSQQCTPGTSTNGTATATPAAGASAGELQLTFVVPSATNLYVCFTPADADATAPAQLLLSRAFVTNSGNGGGGDSSWTTDDLVLLIVGVVFLFILLVLLALLLWRICCFGGMASASRRTRRYRHTVTHTSTATRGAAHEDRSVYMPPRANDRFVYRAASLQTPPPQPQPQPAPLQAVEMRPVASPSSPQQQQQQQPQTDAINVHVSTQSTVQGVAHADPNLSSSSYTTSMATTRTSSGTGGEGPRKKKHHHSHRHRGAHEDGDADETVSITSSRHRAHTDAITVPPLPPRPTTTVAAATPPLAPMSTALPGGLPDLVETPRAAPETTIAKSLPPLPPMPPMPSVQPSVPAVPSGPYQHLHHSQPSSSPMDNAQEPALSSRSSVFSPAEGTGEDGAYAVTGHTSRPMVRSRSKR